MTQSNNSKTDNSAEKLSDLEIAETLVKHFRDEGCGFFVSPQLVPTIRLPDENHQSDWEVDSQRVRDRLVSTWIEKKKQVPTRSVQDLTLRMLREECRKEGRQHSEAESVQAEQDPIVRTLLALMNSAEHYEERTSELNTKLRELELEHGEGGSITPFTSIFSRQLNRLVPVLRGYGVGVAIDHREDGSHVTVTRLGSFKLEPDAHAKRKETPGDTLTADDNDDPDAGKLIGSSA